MPGPATGYSFGNKKQYRRTIWRGIDDAIKRFVPLKSRRVLYLESSEGLETEFLLERGYNSENLFPCNKSAAQVAWATRRFKNVHGFGCDILVALERLNKTDRAPHIIDLDFCGCISNPIVESLTRLSQMLERPCYLNFTVLKGREQWLKHIDEENWIRLFIARTHEISPDKVTSNQIRDTIFQFSVGGMWRQPIETWNPDPPQPYFAPLPIRRGEYKSTSGQIMKYLTTYLVPVIFHPEFDSLFQKQICAWHYVNNVVTVMS
jgi:hypothetical protein